MPQPMPSKRLKNASDIIAATARQDKSKHMHALKTGNGETTLLIMWLGVSFVASRCRESGQQRAGHTPKYSYRHGHAPGRGDGRVEERDAPPEIERRAVDKAGHERREIHRSESAHDDAEDNKQPRLNYIFRLAECENSDFQAQKICRRDYHRHAEVRLRQHCDREREQGDGEDISDLARNFQLSVLQDNPSFHQKSHAPKRCMAKNKPVRFGKIHTFLHIILHNLPCVNARGAVLQYLPRAMILKPRA